MMWRLKREARHMEWVLLAAAGETCSPLCFQTVACCNTVECANSDGGKVATYYFLDGVLHLWDWSVLLLCVFCSLLPDGSAAA
jgi:hypothetical protein